MQSDMKPPLELTHEAFGGDAAIPPPNPELAASAHSRDYPALYRASLEQPLDFWAHMAQDITWHTPFTQVLDDSQAPLFKWFVGSTTNVVTNAIERHLPERANHTALIWEGEDGQVRQFTYGALSEQVNRFANVLASLGVVKGDRVAIYMPRIPEQAIAMLATEDA